MESLLPSALFTPVCVGSGFHLVRFIWCLYDIYIHYLCTFPVIPTRQYSWAGFMSGLNQNKTLPFILFYFIFW